MPNDQTYLPARVGGSSLSTQGGGLDDLSQQLQDAIKSIHTSLLQLAVSCSTAQVVLQGNVTVKLPDGVKLLGQGDDQRGGDLQSAVTTAATSAAEASGSALLTHIRALVATQTRELKEVFRPLVDSLRGVADGLRASGGGQTWAALPGASGGGRGLPPGIHPEAPKEASGGISGSLAKVGIATAAGGALAGPIGAGVAGGAVAIYELAKAAKEAAEKIINMGTESAKMAHSLSDVSPSQALIAAENELRDIFRRQKFGEQTAETARELSQAWNAVQDNLADIKAAKTNLENKALTLALGKLIQPVTEKLGGFANAIDGHADVMKEHGKVVIEHGKTLLEEAAARKATVPQVWFEKMAKEAADRQRAPMDPLPRKRN